MRVLSAQLFDKRTAFAALVLAFSLGTSTGFGKGGAGSFGGGGNSDEDTPVRFADFLTQSRRALEILPAVFRRLEVDAPVSRELYAKLFTQGAVYAVIPQVQWHIEEHQPCFSPEGEARDASAKTEGVRRTVCLSYARLAPQLNSANAASKITSLLAHEVSHLVDASEDEAVLLEQTVKARVSMSTFTLYSFAKAQSEEGLREVIMLLEQETQNQTPAVIGSATLMVEQWLQKASNAALGVQFVGKEDLYRVRAQLMMLKAQGSRGLSTAASWAALLAALKNIPQ